MKEWTWPSVAVFTVVVAAIVIMFGLTDDQQTQAHLIGYLEAIVNFIVGAAAGALVGGTIVYLKVKGKI